MIEMSVRHQDGGDVLWSGTTPAEELGRLPPGRNAVQNGKLAAAPVVPVPGVDQDRMIAAAQHREAVRDLPLPRLAVQQQPERGGRPGELDHPDGVVGHQLPPCRRTVPARLTWAVTRSRPRPQATARRW